MAIGVRNDTLLTEILRDMGKGIEAEACPPHHGMPHPQKGVPRALFLLLSSGKFLPSGCFFSFHSSIFFL